MNKSNAEIWREIFATWPTDFRRKGVLIPSYGEAIPFSDFVMNGDLLIVERPTPDQVGARRVAIPLMFIEGLKYTEPLRTEQFLNAGFAKGVTPKQPAEQPVVPQPEPVAAAQPTLQNFNQMQQQQTYAEVGQVPQPGIPQ